MRARDLMTAPVITVRPCDRLVGIVTEADLIRGRIPVDPRNAHEHREATGEEQTR